MADNRFRFGISLAFLEKEKERDDVARGLLKPGYGTHFTGKKVVTRGR